MTKLIRAIDRLLNGIMLLAIISAMSLGIAFLIALLFSESSLYVKILFGILSLAIVWYGAKGTGVAVTVRKK